MNKSILIGSLAAVVGASALVAAPAQAAFFVDGSTLNISGTVDADPLGEEFLGQPIVGYDFNPLDNGTPTTDNGEGDFNILQSNTGTFSIFNPLPTYYGQITDLPDPTALPVSNFLQFASAGSVDPSDFDIFFELQNIVAIQYNFTGTGLTNSVGVTGRFSRGSETALADGTFSADLTFDTLSNELNPQLAALGGSPITVDEDITQAILTEDVASFNSLTGNSLTQAEFSALTIDNIAFSADFVIEVIDTVEPVPEASNVAGLAGLGLIGALALRKRRQVKIG